MRVGFIGLGSQGGPMARRIIECGFSTTLWARRPASVEPFADIPVKIAQSPAELAAASDLVCLCVVGEADIEEITSGEHGLLAGIAPGAVIAVHSTVHPDTCKALAKRASSKRVSVIDAPVSGGGPAAAKGHLMVMVGGQTDVVESCRPVFETYGDPIVHLGELGTGQTTKLLNNLLFTANLGTAATALALAQSLGVAPDRLVEVVSRGSGNSFALNALG
ncbi:NAD(P)-dependent oxidoreductase, partial [Mycobacterium montefiorense]